MPFKVVYVALYFLFIIAHEIHTLQQKSISVLAKTPVLRTCYAKKRQYKKMARTHSRDEIIDFYDTILTVFTVLLTNISCGDNMTIIPFKKLTNFKARKRFS